MLSTKEEYVNCASKLRYICPKHKDKGELLIDYGHLKNGRGCVYCGRERTIESELIEFNRDEDKTIAESKGFEYVDTVREHGLILIEYICPKHREFGVQKMRKHLYTLAHDEIKNQYCADNNITLIRIPYYEFKNLKPYLLMQFKEHNIIKEIAQ